MLRENERSTEHQLSALRLATPDGHPTAAGLVVLGRDPSAFVPGAYVQFQRHEGTDLASDVLSAREIFGPLPELLGKLEETLGANIATAVDLTSGPLESRRPSVPLVALQQIARNAVMHRTYETSAAPLRITWLRDRVEILSPGGPYGLVTVETFGRPGLTDYRNPTIAEALKALGYVQRFGVGLATAAKAMRENGNPSMVVDAQPTYILITLPLLL